jgi:hypothetical protein
MPIAWNISSFALLMCTSTPNTSTPNALCSVSAKNLRARSVQDAKSLPETWKCVAANQVCADDFAFTTDVLPLDADPDAPRAPPTLLLPRIHEQLDAKPMDEGNIDMEGEDELPLETLFRQGAIGSAKRSQERVGESKFSVTNF